MKKLTLVLSAVVLFAGISFAQQNPDPAKNVNTTKEKTPAKTDKKATDKKEMKKPAKKDASKKETK